MMKRTIDKNAFSLPELLLVLVIIGILVLVALPNLMPLISRAKATEAQQQLTFLHSLEQSYFYTYSRYSDDLSELGFEQSQFVTEGGKANYRIEVISADEKGFKAQAVGYFWSGIRNCWADRVDYWGGATFITDENAKDHQGVTLGAFINADIKAAIPSGLSFNDYVERYDQLYAHEYGHTIQSKVVGLLYPLIGLLSLGSAIADYELHTGHNHDVFFTEVMANRFSSRLFPFYTWGGSDYPTTY